MIFDKGDHVASSVRGKYEEKVDGVYKGGFLENLFYIKFGAFGVSPSIQVVPGGPLHIDDNRRTENSAL